ncbi:MAG: hypothetical protein ACREX4_14520 [Gammaproteobacteria bacterium]
MKPPKSPAFELPPEDPREWWKHVTDEDRAFLKKVEREGCLRQLIDELCADIEEERKAWKERLRRAGFDPDESKNGKSA